MSEALRSQCVILRLKHFRLKVSPECDRRQSSSGRPSTPLPGKKPTRFPSHGASGAEKAVRSAARLIFVRGSGHLPVGRRAKNAGDHREAYSLSAPMSLVAYAYDRGTTTSEGQRQPGREA